MNEQARAGRVSELNQSRNLPRHSLEYFGKGCYLVLLDRMRSLTLRDRHAFRTLVLLSLYKPWYIIDGGTMALGKVRGLKRGEVGHSPTPSLVEIHRVGETPMHSYVLGNITITIPCLIQHQPAFNRGEEVELDIDPVVVVVLALI